jgi:hypothetical protein
MSKRLDEAFEDWVSCHGWPMHFREPYGEAKWRAKQMLGKKLLIKLFDYSFVIGIMLCVVRAIYHYASEGKMPPYGEMAYFKSLEYYEALPVDPDLEDLYYG